MCNFRLDLLDLDDYDAPTNAHQQCAPSSSSASAKPPLPIESSKTDIDFLSDNFIWAGFAAGYDDEDYGTNSIDSSDDEGDGDRESADGEDDHRPCDDSDVAKRETELNRNTDFLVKEFHQADINIAEKEAADKRRDGYVKLFLHADRVYTSPLTRAMQTALLSMEGHRAVECFGFTLYR